MKSVPVLAVFVAVVGIAACVEHFLADDHHNPGFITHPVTTRTHVLLGGLYLAAALAQFSGSLRRSRPDIHRALGRVAAASGLGAAVTAIAIAILFPFSGPWAILILAPIALFFGGALVLGVQAARARDFALHRAWMTRAFAAGSSIATMRLIFVPTLALLGESEETARWLSQLCFALAFGLHAAIAEMWLRNPAPVRAVA